MSTEAGKPLLTAAQACLDFAQVSADIRRVLRQRAPQYEECLDRSLSQELELLGGLMDAYRQLSESPPLLDVEDEPGSYSDAMRSLDQFVGAARAATDRAIKDSTFLFPASRIGVRAETLSCVLRRVRKEEGIRDEDEKGIGDWGLGIGDWSPAFRNLIPNP